MSFVSVQFLLFISLVFLLYFAAPKKVRWVVLLAGSYFYYIISDASLAIYLAITTLSVYGCGMILSALNKRRDHRLHLLTLPETFDVSGETDAADKPVKHGDNLNMDDEIRRERKKIRSKTDISKRWILLLALLINFGILAFFKYSGFFVSTVNSLMNNFSAGASAETFDLLLPLGISFYTFQSLGYIIDVYRDKYNAEKNPAKFALFVSFFPQIIQGPISRYDQLAHQLFAPNKFEYERFKNGLLLILWGFFKKLIIADRAGIIVAAVIPNYTEFSGTEIGIGVFMFMLQVYADFSGGIDIARGVAQCLGIDMAQNFERPHFAVGIGDYWRRWHITLGTWMRDYLMYPLSLSKAFTAIGKGARKRFGRDIGKMIPACLAMTVVFFAVGIWHGAGLKHIMFGAYNGFFIVLGIMLASPIQKIQKKAPWFTSKIIVFRILLTLGTCFIIYISKFFAAANDLSEAFTMIYRTFAEFEIGSVSIAFLSKIGFGIRNFYVLAAACAVFFAVSLMQENKIEVRKFISRRNIAVRWAVYYALIFAILFLSSDFGEGLGEFLYAQF
ncbi:MAG: MBOAT family protein [Oscillospiraceae bacterium]|nr:MBOAT family protein [Oscillospiraceae bacterium]